MYILWKMIFLKCEFCEKWDFRNVNFVKIEISELWILWKMIFQNGEFCKNWDFQCLNFWIKCGLLPQCGLDLEFFGCSPFISSSISSCFWKTMANFKTCQWVVAIPWLGEYIYFAGESSSGSSGIPDSSGGDSRSRHAVGNAQPQSQSCMSEPLSYYRELLHYYYCTIIIFGKLERGEEAGKP